MPQGTTPIPLPPPKLGVYGDLMPYEIPPGYLWRSSNVLTRFGRIRTRPGLAPAVPAGPGARISGGATFRTPAGVTQVVAATLRKWFKLSVGAWTDISGAFTATNNEDNPWRFVVFPTAGVNLLIGVNNIDAPQAWDGVASTLSVLGGSPPIARDITVAGNYVVLGNVVESGIHSGSRVRISGFNNPASWSPGDAVDLTDTNDDIVAVRGLTRTTFAAYKDQSIYLGTAQAGLFPFFFDVVARNVPGPCSPACVVPVGSVHYYLGQDGRIYRFDGMQSIPVSKAVDSFLLTSGLGTQFRTLNRARAWGIYNRFDPAVWFFYPGPNNAEPYLAVSYGLQDGVAHLHTFPFQLTAGWEGDDIASLTWDDLTGTWDTLGLQYPTWDSFGGTLVNTPFIGSASGQVYRQRYDTADDSRPIDMMWEFPLKPWLGLEVDTHVDGVEAFFGKIDNGPVVTVEVGVSEALAEPTDPVYSKLVNLATGVAGHDTADGRRQKLTLPQLDARFWSIRFSASATVPLEFRGAMAAGWPQEVAQS